MSDKPLIERLELVAAWRKPAGPTPKEEMPNTYKTVTDAIAAIREFEAALQQYADLPGMTGNRARAALAKHGVSNVG